MLVSDSIGAAKSYEGRFMYRNAIQALLIVVLVFLMLGMFKVEFREKCYLPPIEQDLWWGLVE